MFRLEREGDLVRLVLDRPEARGAIPASAWPILAERIAEAARPPARLLLLTGTGGAFCAGADLDDFAALRRDAGARVRFRQDMRAALDRLRDLAIPTVAAVEGPCYGAGVALAMACDLRLATASARFAITPARFGIAFPQEDVHRLVELVGAGQAARLLLTGLDVDAGEAVRIGLVELLDPLGGGGGGGLVAAILANDGDSLVTLKRAIRLAAAGRRSDARQDAEFDRLLGGAALARRLEALRRK
jgi:enoyl-CoA hydratase/carnithine racemase